MDGGGEGGVQDYTEAAIWYRKAADQGNAGAQFSLGVLYENGLGLPRDVREAASWYLRAAVQGYSDAEVNLAGLLAAGEAVPADKEQARAWLRKAADQGDVTGEYRLGMSYAEDAVAPSRVSASRDSFRVVMNSVFGERRWRETGGYRTPGREDQLRAEGAETVPVGRLSSHSLGTPSAPGAYDIVVVGLSPSQAAQKLIRSGIEFKRLFAEGSHGTQGPHLHIEPYIGRAKGDASALDHSLIDLHMNNADPMAGDPNAVRAQALDEAVNWFRLAADHGSAPAAFELGRIYAADGPKRNPIEARKWLTAALSSTSVAVGSQQTAANWHRGDYVAATLTVAQLAEARRLVDKTTEQAVIVQGASASVANQPAGK
jgi:TPR repeat protein